MDDTDRVVESEVCETVLLAGTDTRRDDDDMVRNIRSMAIGATFICSRSTIILQIYKTTTRFKSNREKMQTLRIDRHDPGLFAILSVTFLEVPQVNQLMVITRCQMNIKWRCFNYCDL